MMHIYPPSLVEVIKKAWKKMKLVPRTRERPPLPSDSLLQELLAITYHASFLKEEGRRLSYRVIVYPKSEFNEKISLSQREERCAIFSEPRSFSVAEVLRLAPAAESVRSIICVDINHKKQWQIWGLLDTGSNWWEFIHHESNSGRPPPAYLTVSSSNPGELIVSMAGDVLLTLRNGVVYFPQNDLFFDGLVSDYLEPVRRSLYRDTLKKINGEKFDPEGHDDDYPQRFFNFCLSRILTCIRDKGHGGTLLLVPDALSASDSRLTDRVTLKYPCTYNYVWNLMVQSLLLHRQYFDMHFSAWDSKIPIEPKKYHSISILESNREEVDEALSDCFHFIGSLSNIDGAVVMSDRLRVIGYGAEVIALSPTLSSVKICSDAHGKKVKAVPIEGYGTRHRSAFRFCSSYEDSVAFIISQDGGIKVAKRSGPEVFLWPDVNMGSVSL
jgi:hypothetical protein